MSAGDRRLTPFAGKAAAPGELDQEGLVGELILTESRGFMIHGGPGSGKTTFLRTLREQLLRREVRSPEVFDLGPLEPRIHAELVFEEIGRHLLASLDEEERAGASASDSALQSSEELIWALKTALGRLPESKRVVLLLDNFDLVHPWAAVGVANLLRSLYDKSKEHLSFVITAESDLYELATSEHIHSPLRNVCWQYELADMRRAEADRFVTEWLEDRRCTLLREDLDELWYYANGYPAVITRLLEQLESERRVKPECGFSWIVEQTLRGFRSVEPLRTAVRRIDEWVDLGLESVNPVPLLVQLARGESPGETHRAMEMLLALGILRWEGDGAVSWRNTLVQEFWEREGEALLGEWSQRPVRFKEGRVSAAGSIEVSLLLDLGRDFDRRGKADWVSDLNRLAEQPMAGHFEVWTEYDRLKSLGLDLDLFRSEVVRGSFTPIFEASNEELSLDFDRTLARHGEALAGDARSRAVEALEHEWSRWNRVRIQLTRDGAIHVVLVRDVVDPLPLIQILNQMVGLERELGGEDQALSVQWELAVAAGAAFFAQLEACGQARVIGIPDADRWLVGSLEDDQPYPVRDRYVIYLLHKACTCRFQGGRKASSRRFVDVSALSGLKPEAKLSSEELASAGELVSLLEGVMIGGSPGGARIGRFPDLQEREVLRVLRQDLSSWQNELSVSSLDSSLLLFQTTRKHHDSVRESEAGIAHPTEVCRVCGDPEDRTVQNLFFHQGPAPYGDYWACLAIGIRYIIELRWGAQWVARRTTGTLQELANLMETGPKARSRERIEELAEELALSTRLLSHLRDASIPLSTAGAAYAVRKYDALIEVSGLRETIQNAERNIDGINAFLNHHDEQIAQWRAEEVARLVSTAGGVLTVLALIITLPSMWVDFSGDSAMWSYLGLGGKWIPWILGTVTVLVVGVAGWMGVWLKRSTDRLRRLR